MALTGQVAIDAKNTIVVDTAIVPDTGSFEQIVAISDDCFSSGCGCPVDDYIFAYHIVVADRQARSFTFVSEILWLGTEYGTVEYAIVFPHRCSRQYTGVREYFAVVADDDVLVDISKRVYCYVISYFGFGIDIC